MQLELLYKRALFKISGESIQGENTIIAWRKALEVARRIALCYGSGLTIGIVMGGGNIWRGRDSDEMPRVYADHIGMLATVQNMIAMERALIALGVPTISMSAISMPMITETFNQKKMMSHLDKKRVVIFGGGLGTPFNSTDETAALRAAEMEADMLIKFSTVDGIYDKDPRKHEDAIMFDEITFNEVISRGLKIMDATAFTKCQQNNVPIHVLNMDPLDNIVDAVTLRKKIGTVVKG